MDTKQTIEVTAWTHQLFGPDGDKVTVEVPASFSNTEMMWQIFREINNRPCTDYDCWQFARDYFPEPMREVETGKYDHLFYLNPIQKDDFLRGWKKIWDALDLGNARIWGFRVIMP